MDKTYKNCTQPSENIELLQKNSEPDKNKRKTAFPAKKGVACGEGVTQKNAS